MLPPTPHPRDQRLGMPRVPHSSLVTLAAANRLGFAQQPGSAFGQDVAVGGGFTRLFV